MPDPNDSVSNAPDAANTPDASQQNQPQQPSAQTTSADPSQQTAQPSQQSQPAQPSQQSQQSNQQPSNGMVSNAPTQTQTQPGNVQPSMANHPAVQKAALLNTIAQTLAGGPRYTTSVDVNTGQTTRTPVPLSRGDIGLAIAMEAIGGAMSGLSVPNGPGNVGRAAALVTTIKSSKHNNSSSSRIRPHKMRRKQRLTPL